MAFGTKLRGKSSEEKKIAQKKISEVEATVVPVSESPSSETRTELQACVFVKKTSFVLPLLFVFFPLLSL